MISDAKKAELDAIAAIRSGLMVSKTEPPTPPQEHHIDGMNHFEHEVLRRLEEIERLIEKLLYKPLSTGISFMEITMLSVSAGNTLVYTGTLSPVGSVFAPDATFTVTSNDPAVLPTVDATGLIVTVPLPAGWVESTTTPLAISYASASASTGQALTATITPGAETGVLATSILFKQTT